MPVIHCCAWWSPHNTDYGLMKNKTKPPMCHNSIILVVYRSPGDQLFNEKWKFPVITRQCSRSSQFSEGVQLISGPPYAKKPSSGVLVDKKMIYKKCTRLVSCYTLEDINGQKRTSLTPTPFSRLALVYMGHPVGLFVPIHIPAHEGFSSIV